ncbi:MAG: S8 family serine peptidase [Urechidicola sp.]|nr:S8 family serine peptidase [Urechidicola sp.]
MRNLYTIILCFFFFSIQAQNYYYNGSEKIEIYQSKKSFISYDKPSQSFAKGFKNVKTFLTKGFTLLEEEKSDISARKFRNEKLTQTTPALLLDSNGDFKMFPTKIIRIKLKDSNKKDDVSKLFKNNDIIEIEEKYDVLRIKIRDINKALEVANKINESGIAEFSIPDFYIPMELNQVNDPLFPLQFQMHNTGQIIDGVAGVNDIDVNALQAWDINLGDNITVAVFDQGMENHEDFGNRLIGGNTPATNGNGTPLANGATHGMNCAGVIGASDDNLGLRGVAPNVNFLSVNIFAGGTTPGDIADGIQWAIDNGADVLSNSWSYSNAPCNFTNILIENALQNAVNNGRNGDGAIVIFSAGNTGGCVNYPARNNNAISVGAIDNRGILFEYSSRGTELDLVAPSGETNYLGNVRTTDRMGNAGRLPGHYEPSFGGTSASCPVVSGVAALVLSVNPNLTQQEVRNILTSTATDMGANGVDNNFGFGRVNAFSAVQAALSSNTYDPYIRGARYITPGTGGFYTIGPYPNATNYVWNIPTGCHYGYCWEIVQGQGTNSALIHGGSIGIYDITCKVYNGSTQIGNQYITVKVQNPYNGGGGEDPCEGLIPMVIYPPEPCDEILNNNSQGLYFIKITIYNLQGQRVLEANNTKTLDTSNLNSGIYIVKGQLSNGEIMTKKILR